MPWMPAICSNPPWRTANCRAIGATTLDEFHKHIEKDDTIERRFAPIYVEEPNVDDTIKMLQGFRDRYEAHHKVRFADEAIVAAARLADRYVTDRRLPDKAIDLMDEAAAKLRVALYSMPADLKEMKAELEPPPGRRKTTGLPTPTITDRARRDQGRSEFGREGEYQRRAQQMGV